jgi:hypothetical protein
MKKQLIALALSMLAVGADAAQPIQNEVALKAGQKVQVAQDKGTLTIKEAADGKLSYRVEFVPDRKKSWWETAQGPTPRDYEDCKATYSAEQGLRILTGKGLNAVAVLNVPSKPGLDAQLKSGVLTIGQRTGRVEAFIGSGILEYDAGGLPAGTCVNASMNTGTVTNERDFNCDSVGAVLHGNSGIITVK